MRLSRRRAPISARVGRLVAAVAVAAAAALPRLAGATRAVSKVALSVVDDDATALAVSWYSAPGDVLGLGLSLAQFGPTRARLQEGVAEGYNYTFVDANTNRSYALHVAVMRGLVPGASYYYRVGDPTDGWSAISTFTATRTAASVTPATPFRVGMFGDAGWFGASAVPPLQTEAALGALDIVVSLGDQAYNLDYQNGNVGDQYLDALSSISSVVPLQGAVGNHEVMWDFAHYTYRMRGYVGGGTRSGVTPAVPGIVPGQPNNHFYAFTAGNIRFVVVSTEAYFYYNASEIQYEWLDSELGRTNRSATPWLVVFGHRSMYCSCDSDCDADAATVRDGPLGLEALLHRHGVDVWLNGHEHNYERNYPTTFGGAPGEWTRGGGAPGGGAAAPEVIVNPTAPVYVVVGHAGNVEGHELFTRPQPARAAFRSATFGYARVTAFNASALLLEAVLADPGQPAGDAGRVIDAMLLVTDHRVGRPREV